MINERGNMEFLFFLIIYETFDALECFVRPTLDVIKAL